MLKLRIFFATIKFTDYKTLSEFPEAFVYSAIFFSNKTIANKMHLSKSTSKTRIRVLASKIMGPTIFAICALRYLLGPTCLTLMRQFPQNAKN